MLFIDGKNISITVKPSHALYAESKKMKRKFYVWHGICYTAYVC